MEKIKITVEQEKALSSYVKLFETLDTTPLKNFIEKASPFKGMYNILNGFTPEQFSLLLCGWYEVEKPFKVGDWVYDSLSGNYAKIVNLHDGYIKFLITTNFNTNYWVSSDYIEKVTEPCKIMLLELGREKPELRMGDMYIDNKGFNWMINSEEFLEKHALPDFESGRVKIFFPVEKGIEVKRND